MKDCSGRKICIGDIVATNVNGYTSSLELCSVVGFTKCKVKLEYYATPLATPETLYKFPKQVCLTGV